MLKITGLDHLICEEDDNDDNTDIPDKEDNYVNGEEKPYSHIPTTLWGCRTGLPLYPTDSEESDTDSDVEDYYVSDDKNVDEVSCSEVNSDESHDYADGCTFSNERWW